MSKQINEEVLLLLVSCYGGLVLIICYDAIRILRRIFKSGEIRTIIEDVIFWTVASIYIFNIFLKYNNGMPRYYTIGMCLLTMIMFEWFIGRHFIDKIAKAIGKILKVVLKPLKKVIEVIKLKLKSFIKRIRIWNKEGKVDHKKSEPLED